MGNSMITVKRPSRSRSRFHFIITHPMTPASWIGQATTMAFSEAQARLQISRRLNAELRRTPDAVVIMHLVAEVSRKSYYSQQNHGA